MTKQTNPPVEAPKPEATEDGELGLGQLLTEMQAQALAAALTIPPIDRTDTEIEADFDNMPV